MEDGDRLLKGTAPKLGSEKRSAISFAVDFKLLYRKPWIQKFLKIS